MAVSNRIPILNRGPEPLPERHSVMQPLAGVTGLLRCLWHPGILLLLAVSLLPGCGLVFDAVHRIYPVTTDDLDRICRRQQVHVGMAVEPFRPFVFPAIWTDEGARVTGLDVELVRLISDALTAHCGRPVTPALNLVRFRDLFLFLNEGQLDFFVSAVAAGTPSPTRSGFAYSIPYLSQGGLGAIATRQDVTDLIQGRLKTNPDVATRERLLDGLTVAVQDSTSAHLYAEANLPAAKILVCDSLPAAFEHTAAGATPAIDIIIGAHPVLAFMVKTTRRDWRLLEREPGIPLQFTQADYAVVMAEERYKLGWFINRVIFQLTETGRLQHMRHRWLDEPYAYPRRASTEGLPFDVQKMPTHYAQGACRESSAR